MTTERIAFERAVDVSDGANGTEPGEAENVYSCYAEVKTLKPSRTLEANQVSLRQGYLFVIWINSQFEPRNGDVIQYRGERLTLTGYRYTDETNRKYELTALESIGSAISNPG